MPANRTSNYIATIPMKNEEQVLEVKKVLEQIFGWVTLRGRHSDRKSVVKGWSKSRQNDVPWRQAQYIDIYLHSANPNRMRIWKKQGMERQNLSLSNTNVMIARTLGSMGYSLADGVKHAEQSRPSSPLMAIKELQYQTQMQDPKFRRKEMKRKYMNKGYHLQPGDWGFIAQSLLDYTETSGKLTFTQLKTYYDVILRGNKTIQKGGSFIHHLQSLVSPANALGRRCKRYLHKDIITGKYRIATM
ncbi:MAG: hypothetical protein RLZZ196_2696 [Bacteroidota bacterium]|jgi:hypothetical protein